MSYDTNLLEAINNVKKHIGDVYGSLPNIVRSTLIEQERQLLHNKWLTENSKKSIDREKKAKEFAKKIMMRSNLEVERIGGGFLPAYKRRKSVSISIEESCEFPHVEKNPVLKSGARIFGFQKSTILGMKRKIINAINEAAAYENVTKGSISYMYFKLFNRGRVVSSTRGLNVHEYSFEEDVDNLFKEYDKIVEKINDSVYGYENLFSGNSNTYTVFFMTALYFPSPKSVLFWGKNIPNILRCDIFDIFTANDTNKDCIEQCSEYLWNKSFKNLDQIIEYANGNICIVCPQTYINHVQEIKSYSDIRVHPDSPIKTLSVIDPSVKYLLHFKEHIGVLFNFTQQKKNMNVTKFTPLSKYSKVEKMTVCFDIEAYFDPENEGKQTNIPYLCCACFTYDDKIANVVDFEGRDCVSQMIEYIVDVCGELGVNKIELIAHNGGAYDFHYILSSMYDPSIIKNILIRNNSFISFKFKTDGVEFSVKDSYSFLLCSLSNAAKAFLSGEHDFKKTDFPHHDVNSVEDLEKFYRKWRSVESIIDVDIEKEKIVLSSRNVINYDKSSNVSKKLKDWSKEYCRNDVIVLAKVWLEFKRAVFEIFNSKVVDQCLTLAGMSFKLFEANVSSEIRLYHPKKEDYMNMRDSLIGGRCISLNGIYEDVLCLDVKSLYPASMAFYDQPYGNFKRVKTRPDNELGIYYVQVLPTRNPKSNFFPIRHNNKICYSNFGNQRYNAWYTSVDIDIGLKEGHNIGYIPFDKEGNIGYSWENKGKIFKEYIENVLYKLKLKYEIENNKVKRNVIKIIMNSLWGKFAQKWINTDYCIKADSDIDFDLEEAYKIWDTEFMLIKKAKETKYSSKPIQNGVFTLSWARYHMKLIWDSCAKPNAVCLYSDTDSLCVDSKSFDLNGKITINNKKVSVVGEEIGQLELECTFDKLLCAGKKQYMGFYTYLNKNGEPEIKEKKRFKGIPASYITPELYTHLLENKDKVAQVKFLKFRREWGSVKGYIESKNVKMT